MKNETPNITYFCIYIFTQQFSDSDVEGERIVESSCALLTGRSGCGKTAAVYALAEELGLHVLEVNASTCRTGKQVRDFLFLFFDISSYLP